MVCESIFSLIFQLQLQSIAINIHTICFPRLYPRQPCTIFSSFYVSYYQYLDFTIYHSIFLYYVLSHNYIYYYNIIHFYLFKCHSNVITYLNVIFGNWKLQSKFWMKIKSKPMFRYQYIMDIDISFKKKKFVFFSSISIEFLEVIFIFIQLSSEIDNNLIYTEIINWY